MSCNESAGGAEEQPPEHRQHRIGAREKEQVMRELLRFQMGSPHPMNTARRQSEFRPGNEQGNWKHPFDGGLSDTNLGRRRATVQAFDPAALKAMRAMQKERAAQEAPSKGLSQNMATLFIVGVVSSYGIFTLPFVLKQSGWLGMGLLLWFGVNSMYSSACLGWCWIILEERWPEYRESARIPLSAIGYRVSGKWLQNVVSFCIQITLCFMCTMCLLRGASEVNFLVSGATVSYCYLVISFAFVMLTLTVPATSRDLWYVAVVTLGVSGICISMLVAFLFLDKPGVPHTVYEYRSVLHLLQSFTWMQFCFFGNPVFPTIRGDMEDRKAFPRAAAFAYAAVTIVFLPVAILGYAAYGDAVTSNIIDTVTERGTFTWMLLPLHIFFLLKVVLTFIVLANPLFQEMEELFAFPKGFGVRKVVLRVVVMLIMVLVALLSPQVLLVAFIVGAITVNCVAFVFPPLFYIGLVRQKKLEWRPRLIGTAKMISLLQIMAVGVIAAVFATYNTSVHITHMPFEGSCFYNMSASPYEMGNI